MAWLGLLPAHRQVAGGLRRAGADLRGRGAGRRRLRRRRAGGGAGADGQRRDGRDLRQLGRHPRLRHGRPLEPRARRCDSQPVRGRRAPVRRRAARGRGGVRCLGLRQADRAAGGLSDDRGARRDEPANRLVGRADGSFSDPGAHRAGRHPGARSGRLPGGRSRRCLRRGRRDEPRRLPRQPARGAGQPGVQERAPQAGRGAPDLPRRGADAALRRFGRVTRGPADAFGDHTSAGRGRAGAEPDPWRPPAGHRRRPRRPLPDGRRDRAR